MPSRSTSTAARLIGLLLVLAGAGCNTIPGMSTTWVVNSVVERGPYLDVTLSNGGDTMRYFTPASETCRNLLRVEQPVGYVSLGQMGQFQTGEVVCVPVGILSLREWRDQRPRPGVPPLPTGQANYRLDYEDKDVAMLRGRFPLVGLIGFVGLGDTIVVLPKTPACTPLLSQSVATIEYRDAGPDPYVLFVGDRRCPVLGLVQPPEGSR
jgi:hypothetical protein